MSDPLRPYHDFSADAEGDAPGLRRAPRPQAEDPLAELARILGEGTAHPVRPEHVVEVGRRVLPSKPAPQQISDLEAELFESLRSSVAPEERVRGAFERETPPIIPQHPVDDHDIASLRAVTAGEAASMAVAETPHDPRLADYYAYDDGVAAGSYDPAFEQPEARPLDLDEAFAAEIHRARGGQPPQPTFADFDTDAIAVAAREASPYVAGDSTIRPHSALEEDAVGHLPREGGGGLKVAVFVVGALLMGGGALAGWKYLGGASTRGPVVLHADGKPLKVIPDPSKATPAGDGEVSLKRDVKVDGSKIVSLQEDPVEHVAGRTADGREVRVINPGAQRPATADQPRTVKTVVVRPDGSIVSEDGAPVAPPAAPPSTPAAAAVPPAPATPVATAPTIAKTVTTPIGPTGGAPAPTLPAPPSVAPVATTPEATPTVPATPVPMPSPAPVRPAAVETAAPAKPVVATPVRTQPPTAAPTHVVATTTVKPTAPRAEAGAPMALGPVAPRLAAQPQTAPQAVASAPTTIAPTSGGSGDWAVQLSASKSEADARSSYASAQRRFSALAGKPVEVQRADLGAKGTFYRAKVPAGSREAAAALCGQIKAQGGDCMVTRR
ncbi:MAG: SPOR domain-containing protein [Hyphomicrobiales bacterium]|nr:SPOR domain-containing protein [Hyphomicrobiales bacterium]